MKNPHPQAEPLARLSELVKEINIAMLTTVTADGSLRSRPMGTQQIDLVEGAIWFFTSSDSPKSDEILHKQHVNLSYAAIADQHYVSVSGRAHLVRDPAKTRELWKPSAQIWFPGGIDDPTLALLRVDVTSAEYWDAPSSKMVQFFGLAQFAVTGKAGNALGKNVKVEIISRDLQS